MKLTIPAPQNMKRREAFLLAHPEYYPKERFKWELLRIANLRTQKKIRFWNKAEEREHRMKETAKNLSIMPVQPKKPSMFKRCLDWVKPKINRASQRSA